jgi:arylsulfatase
MENNLFILGALYLFMFTVLGGCTKSERAPDVVKQDTQPNIVLILTDDQAYADTSAFGQEAYTTPNIDSIANNGVMLTNFYVSQPVCSTSRASILTGAYANRLGISYAFFPTELTEGPAVGLNPAEETLPELLKQSGYTTGLFGKWHLGDTEPFLPTNHGFDVYYGIPYSNDMWSANATKQYDFGPLPVISQTEVVKTLTDDQSDLTQEITYKSIDFINANKDKPFFLMLAHPQPHVPLFVSKEFEGKSGAGLYGDVMLEIDWSTGAIQEALKANGIFDNTILIFMSDNGPWLVFGDHAGSTGGLRNGKLSVFEGGVRTPTSIQWPAKLKAQAPIDTPMMSIDLLPTLVKLADASLPQKEIDGKNVWPIISGKQTQAAHEAYFFYFHKNDLSAVRYQDYKLYYPHTHSSVVEKGAGGVKGQEDFVKLDAMRLYNLKDDPTETKDISNEHPEIIAIIEKLADEKRAELGDDLRGIKGNERRALGSL